MTNVAHDEFGVPKITHFCRKEDFIWEEKSDAVIAVEKELEERKGKIGGVGDEGVSDERAVPVARGAFERPMHVDPPENPPASPAVKRRTDHMAIWVEAERFWKIRRVDQQTDRILQASEADADAERRAFLKAFEADDQERRRDEALESALRAYEPTSPTSASVSVHDIQ